MSYSRFDARCAAIVLALCVQPAITHSSTAGDAGTVEVQDEPHHHVVFENAAVRILEVNIPAGISTLYHRHRRDNAAVALTDIAATNQRLSEPLSPSVVRKAGGLNFSRAAGEGYVHQVTNVGDIPFRVVDIEFLRAPGVDSTPDSSAPTPSADNERFRAYTVTILPGQSSAPLRLAAGVQVVVSGNHVARLSDDGAAHMIDTSAHPWQWRDTGIVILRNDSETPALVVEIEIK